MQSLKKFMASWWETLLERWACNWWSWLRCCGPNSLPVALAARSTTWGSRASRSLRCWATLEWSSQLGFYDLNPWTGIPNAKKSELLLCILLMQSKWNMSTYSSQYISPALPYNSLPKALHQQFSTTLPKKPFQLLSKLRNQGWEAWKIKWRILVSEWAAPQPTRKKMHLQGKKVGPDWMAHVSPPHVQQKSATSNAHEDILTWGMHLTRSEASCKLCKGKFV